MNVLIGKYTMTHGINGEIRIKSNFKYKDKVFKKDNVLIINNKNFIIESYRVHKEYDMVKFIGIDNINDILDLKGYNVYIKRDDLNLSDLEYLDTDLINYDVYMGNIKKGVVSDIKYLNLNKKLLVVNNLYVPFELIEKIDFLEKKIIIKKIEGLL